MSGGGLLNKPDIVLTLEREGITLKPHGKARMTLCVFHDDKIPSIAIYPETNTYHCFSCGAHGDSISFVMRYRGISFKEALSYLAIASHRPPKTNEREVSKRRLVAGFREWEKKCHAEFCTQYRTIQNHKTLVTCMNDIDEAAYHSEPLIAHRLNILDGTNDERKFRLFEEVVNGRI